MVQCGFQLKIDHLVSMDPNIQRRKYLDESVKKIVDPVVQRNAFYAHPENLLLIMLADNSKVQREIAYRIIKKSREENRFPDVRKVTVATSYSSLI